MRSADGRIDRMTRVPSASRCGPSTPNGSELKPPTSAASGGSSAAEELVEGITGILPVATSGPRSQIWMGGMGRTGGTGATGGSGANDGRRGWAEWAGTIRPLQPFLPLLTYFSIVAFFT